MVSKRKHHMDRTTIKHLGRIRTNGDRANRSRCIGHNVLRQTRNVALTPQTPNKQTRNKRLRAPSLFFYFSRSEA